MKFETSRHIRVSTPTKSDIEMLRASALFDAEWYANRYVDVRLVGLSPEEHYLLIGAILLRDPSDKFSTAFYLTDNPDVAMAGVNPLIHFIQHGASEGRNSRPHIDGSALRSPDTTVGPDPWLRRLWTGPFLDEILPKTEPLQELSESQRGLARSALNGAPPRISVVMPSWNREAVVCRALQSAFGQSLRPAEVILVDDGSEDATLDVVRREFAREIRDGHLKVIAAEHAGVSAARNHGLAAASGDLIAYLDSDNAWRPDYLLTMAAAFAEADTLSTAYCCLSMNDAENKMHDIRGRPYDRRRLIGTNYIDLNVFMHRRALYDQYGGFDTKLKRLVDWDLIARYTKLYEPAYLPLVGVEYYLDRSSLGNITRTVPLSENKGTVIANNRGERLRRGLEPLRLAYVLWDWPALSQTFVVNEIRWLVEQGHDVKVYYHIDPDRAAELDFRVETHRVSDDAHLAELLTQHHRNQIHAHFAYPCTTLLAWPAAQKTGIRFTFFAHAVDIFHEKNILRNRIAEVVSDPLCQRLFVHGDYHRGRLEPLGVPTSKIAYNFQAVDLDEFGLDEPLATSPDVTGKLRGLFVGRLVEKKGVPVLLEAAAQLDPELVHFDIHGYGPDEPKIVAQAQQLALQNITMGGALDGRDAVTAAMRAADFVIVPSVVAANGDTEGFPTVILEAMALGRPVVTSDVSAIPDFLDDEVDAIVVPSGDPKALADGVRRLLAMSPNRVTGMLRKARNFLKERVGTDLTMQTYLDTWREAEIEIVLVTYDTSEYRDIEDTREIIRRIRDHTTTPYTLTVVDNGSDAEFLGMLRGYAAEMPNMRLMELSANRFCGGGTNIALAASDAIHAIYICSKEGFVQRHGWERPIIKAMRDDEDADMGGYKCHMPKFTKGAELLGHPAFAKFRNQPFAVKHSERPFQHVQGGLYILRRDSVTPGGGFSKALPHGHTDVEFSYFLESEGRKLISLEAISALTVKTRPMLSAVMDEKTTIAHPLTRESAQALTTRMKSRDASRCNICEAWDRIDPVGNCASCGSSGTSRKIYQRLAHDWRGFRKGRALLLGAPESLDRALTAPMYDVKVEGSVEAESDADWTLIVSTRPLSPEEVMNFLARLAPHGLLIWPSEQEDLEPWMLPQSRRTSTDRCSRLLRSDWRPLQEAERL